MAELPERRLRAAAKTLELLDAKPLPPASPERRLLDRLIAGFGDLLEHVLPTGDADAACGLLCAIEAGLVRLCREDSQAARGAERRKLREARASMGRLRRRVACQARQPRVRSAHRRRRPRTARRRAAGLRSGQDPGEDGECEPGVVERAALRIPTFGPGDQA